jgi:hypothetical protein
VEKNEKKKTKDGKIDFRSGQPRLVAQSNKTPIKPDSSTSSKSQDAKKNQMNPDANVAINDVKNAAIMVLSERYYIPANFVKYCKSGHTSVMVEEFLLCLSNYFHLYFENIDSNSVLSDLCM